MAVDSPRMRLKVKKAKRGRLRTVHESGRLGCGWLAARVPRQRGAPLCVSRRWPANRTRAGGC